LDLMPIWRLTHWKGFIPTRLIHEMRIMRLFVALD
jgi:hypothetical protein